jgi:hypothetical protein
MGLKQDHFTLLLLPAASLLGWTEKTQGYYPFRVGVELFWLGAPFPLGNAHKAFAGVGGWPHRRTTRYSDPQTALKTLAPK